MEILKRERYLKAIRPFYDTDLIKVITGVRRCGKSFLLDSIREELKTNGVDDSHILYINFEDLDNASIDDAKTLDRHVKERLPEKGKSYVFLDEIQHVHEFEKALASLRASRDLSIFVTGSNSRLLSGELATLLTGRTVEFEIFPFSFGEMWDLNKLNGWDIDEGAFYEYLKWGGMPGRFLYHDETSIRNYAENLYNGIVNRDAVPHSNASERQAFKDIAGYILSNAGKEFSVDNVVAHYRDEEDEGKSISRRSVYNYLDRMKKAYLIQSVSRYAIQGKSALSNREKHYAVDVAFRTIQTNTIDSEDTFFLENVIHNELRSRGYLVFAGKTYKGEVDFVAVKNGRKCFIQVAYLMPQQSTVEREFGAYEKITDASPKYVLSLDRIDLSRNGITHLNIVDFLLGKVNLNLS